MEIFVCSTYVYNLVRKPFLMTSTLRGAIYRIKKRLTKEQETINGNSN
jgi:hypothetical protein